MVQSVIRGTHYTNTARQCTTPDPRLPGSVATAASEGRGRPFSASTEYVAATSVTSKNSSRSVRTCLERATAEQDYKKEFFRTSQTITLKAYISLTLGR